MQTKFKVVVYGTKWCIYCIAARRLLKNKKIKYENIIVSNANKRKELELLSGGKTVPQIFINGKPIGGFDQLLSLEENGFLESMLEKS